MDRCMPLLILLLMGRHGLCQQEEVCSKSLINSCDDCIKSGPYCAWCQTLNFTKDGEQDAVRCNTRAELVKRGCKENEIISPKNKRNIAKDDPLSASQNGQVVQMRPQKIDLDLRPGFGAFVDKTVLPYTNTNKKKLKKPCDENDQQCQPAFGYRHVLSLTPNKNDFEAEVKKQFISGNLDSPEGSLDAMMQAAVCEDKIGWNSNSTRLIVLTTDAGFHMAGDGKLAGILEPNDEKCYMENNLYVKSTEMDYPSVGQLAMQLEKNRIQTIFAVTQNVESVYKELSKMIPKSEVGVLSSDSKNVVQLIERAYNALSSKVTITHDNLPEKVRVVYRPICRNGEKSEKEGVCDQVHVGDEVIFEITVTADTCMENKFFTISPRGIKDTLTVTINTTCKCQCDTAGPIIDPHPHCNMSGSISCGICSCKDGHVGQFCNCKIGNKQEHTLRASCQKDNGTECEGRGDCVCGRCECHNTDSGSQYYGPYCECDDDHCEKFQNQQCGGKGRCKCGKCECNSGFEGSACQCKTSDEACRTVNNSVCNGRGICKCNQCECKGGYQRPHCLECPGCTDPCQTKVNCIECLGFESGPFKKNCSEACKTISSTIVKEAFTLSPKECKQKDSEGCWMTFKLVQLVGEDNYKAEIMIKRDCPKPPNVIAIIGGSIAAVALIGILLLMLIKLLLYMKDLKEFRKFENEKKKSKWAEADNPLFQTATTTVANPTFTGGE
uniref:Integrin beta n=1 Tax=Astatotilapia calliptera TaxID=8154 RepID=A0A3P8R4N3_ASTCA